MASMRKSIATLSFVFGLASGLTAPAWAGGLYAAGHDVVRYVFESYLILYMNTEGLRVGCFF